MSKPPQTKRGIWRRKWRRSRLDRTPPKGTKCCIHCLNFRPIAAFHYNYGERSVCLRCYQMKEAHREKRTAWKRESWRKKPENKKKANRFVREFVTKRKPWIMAFYKFRQLVDDLLDHGSETARDVLEQAGVSRDVSCRLCGTTENLQVFWPDYSKPQTFYKYCAHHRRIESFGDTRTLEEQAIRAEVGREVIRSIRAKIGQAGINYYQLSMSLKKAK